MLKLWDVGTFKKNAKIKFTFMASVVLKWLEICLNEIWKLFQCWQCFLIFQFLLLVFILHAFGAHATRNTGMSISSNKQHSHVMVNLTIGEESNFDFIYYYFMFCHADMTCPSQWGTTGKNLLQGTSVVLQNGQGRTSLHVPIHLYWISGLRMSFWMSGIWCLDLQTIHHVIYQT